MAPGYQSIVPRGYIRGQWGGATYVAPLRPDFFYGVGGTQLGHTWRQWFASAGEQVVLSRGPDSPNIPHDPSQVAWRKVSTTRKAEAPAEVRAAAVPTTAVFLAVGALLVGALLVVMSARST